MLGIDIVDIDKIKNLKKRDRFLQRFFTPDEREYLQLKNNSYQTMAGIFSAKEAVAKAFKTGIGAKIGLKDIEIGHQDQAPYVKLTKKKIRRLLQEKGYDQIAISISHDGKYAISQAILHRSTTGPRPMIDPTLAQLLPERNEDFNKYDYGNVLIIGGKRGMHGSVSLASLASMRTGSGLCHLLIPDSIYQPVANRVLEPIIHVYKSDCDGEFSDFDHKAFIDFIEGFDAIAFGPGIGRKAPARKMLGLLLKNYQGPVLIDADGINLLKDLGPFEKKNVYISPHEKEFARLLQLDINLIKKDRLGACKEFLKKYSINLLLKGKNSIIINERQVYINKSGSSALATAGSGDSLTGIIISLLARRDHIDMMKLAAYIHGLAGDYASLDLGEDSVIASDIVNYIPEVIKDLRREEVNAKQDKNQQGHS
ncbi:MAG: NAD(P)H-hydrate dehydratase [Tissierellia bacterium]|nr:NAD(P)H-hydrate dehydratase [Tissierellia bacterium]